MAAAVGRPPPSGEAMPYCAQSAPHPISALLLLSPPLPPKGRVERKGERKRRRSGQKKEVWRKGEDKEGGEEGGRHKEEGVEEGGRERRRGKQINKGFGGGMMSAEKIFIQTIHDAR